MGRVAGRRPAGARIGAYDIGRVSAAFRPESVPSGEDRPDLDYSFLGHTCEYPRAGEIWRQWATRRPVEPGEWARYPSDWHESWMHVVQTAWFDSGRNATRYETGGTAVIDGSGFTTRTASTAPWEKPSTDPEATSVGTATRSSTVFGPCGAMERLRSAWCGGTSRPLAKFWAAISPRVLSLCSRSAVWRPNGPEGLALPAAGPGRLQPPCVVSMTQKRLPSGSASTTKSGSGGYSSHATLSAPSPISRSTSASWVSE